MNGLFWRIHLALLVLVVWTVRSVAAQAEGAPACRGGRTALVLSGGGAKGLAHVGVIAALEAAGVRPDFVVGTSMGAMIGALYASGYQASEIDSIARTLAARDLFNSHELRGPGAWGTRIPLILWSEGERGFTLQSSAVRQAELNGALNAAFLRGNLMARGDFDRLVLPMRVVATDLQDRAPVVLRGGDLAQAVRASIAIPLVFTPQRIAGRTLADGGLSANIPVSIARAEGATRVFVSDVTERHTDSLDLDSPLVVADRLLNWLFRQPADSLGADDLMVRSDVEGFRSLDFSPSAMEALIQAGRAAGDSMLAAWHCTPALTRPSVKVGAPNPTSRRTFSVAQGGNDPAGLRLVERMLAPDGTTSLEEIALQQRLFAIGERDLLQELWLAPTGSANAIVFEPTLRRLPRRMAGIGLAYDTELGGRVWGGLLDRNFPVLHIEASGVLGLGRFQRHLDLGARRATLLGRSAFSPVATIALRSDDIRRFDGVGVELEADDYRGLSGTLGVERFIARTFRLTLVGVAQHWRETDLVTRVERTDDALGGRLALESLADDHGRNVRAQVVFTGSYRLASAELHGRRELGRLRVEPTVRLGVGETLPAALTFPLGGDEGFPGLHLGERRGDREAFGSLALSAAVSGPLRVRVMGAVGRTAFGEVPNTITGSGGAEFVKGGLFGSGGWLLGARVGVGSDTPLGPVRIEYGWNDAGREALYLRVGRWF